MKKIFWLLVLAMALPLHAQEWSLAPKFGLNLSDMSGDYFRGGIRPGINAGLSVERRFSTLFALEPGVFYSMQGLKDKEDNEVRKNDFINVPILAKFYIKNGFNIFAGPQVGVNISEKVVYTGEGGGEFTMKTDDIMPVDVSLMVGIGYQFKAGLLLSTNYNIGLSDSADNSGDTPARNRVFQVNIGWRLNL